MNGAESLVRTLVKGGVEVCFANPGTSEMHFVGALDRVEGMRCVLGLFEGVCSGAADGYYRMTDKPASTLLHLGPGLANAAANLHNAKKAGSGIVNIVGEHALYHIKYDTPLTADIEGIARPFSHWVKTSPTSKTVATDGAAAIQAARVAPGQIATLILPADTAWTEADGAADTPETPQPQKPANEDVVAAAKALKSGQSAMLFIGGRALRARGLELAGKIAAKTGCKVQAAGGTARIERGAGRVPVLRLHFVVETAQEQLKGTKHMVLCGAKAPAAFFAYPGKPSVLVPDGCEVTTLCPVEGDPIGSLEALAAELDAMNEKPARGAAQAARSADRQVHARRPRPGARRHHAGRRHRRRRIGDDRPRLLPVQRRRPAARLAEQHGRLDRLRRAGRGRRGRRLPGPQGHLHDRRRLGDVHHPVAVDDGAREPRRLRDDLLQPQLQDPLQPARRCRRGQSRPARHRHADARSADARVHHAGQGHGRAGRARRTTSRSSPSSSPTPCRTRART